MFIELIQKKKVQLILLLIFITIAPLLFQHSGSGVSKKAEKSLVVMTPHNTTIQAEFGEAFTEYWQQKTGQIVHVDWRRPGNAGEIKTIVEDNFRRADRKNEAGINVDVLFGGGDYLFKQLAAADRLVKLDVFEQRKSWFDQKGIQPVFSGERSYGKDLNWVGVCMGEFGICFNVEGLKRIGVEPPKTWDDLAHRNYFGKIALADPTKSGSTARAFEMLIQQKIQVELANSVRRPGETAPALRNRCIREGWAKGLNLIKRISANARYFTDSATKIPHDVAQGDAVAGMCVDYYGRTYNEKLTKEDGTSRLIWIAPEGGTSIGVDPAAVFKGANEPELAQAFVDFLLTEQGQVLWNKKPGTTNGPKYNSLRRLPIRPDVYTPENLKDFTDADQNPYARNGGLEYNEEITGELFEALREQIRVMCIDTHDDLTSAWQALIENADEHGVMSPDGMRRFNDVALFSYKKTSELKKLIEDQSKGNSLEQQKRTLRAANRFNDLAAIFRRAYSDAKKRAVTDIPTK